MSKSPDRHSNQYETVRAKLRLDSTVRFITAEEFAVLTISNQQLERFEIREANVIGLRDNQLGVSYLVESENLSTDRTW